MRISPVSSYTFSNSNNRYQNTRIQHAQCDTVTFSGSITKFVKPEPVSELGQKIVEKMIKYAEFLPEEAKMLKPLTIKVPNESGIDKYEILIDKSRKNNPHITIKNSIDHYRTRNVEEMSENTFEFNQPMETLILKFNKDGQLEEGEHLFSGIGKDFFERDKRNMRKITVTQYDTTEVYIPDKSSGKFRESMKSAIKRSGNAAGNGKEYHNSGSTLADIFESLTGLKTSIFVKK